MGLQAAIDTRKIAQKIKSVMPNIWEGYFNERALLKLAEKRVKWSGSHTKFDWRVRYVPSGNTAVFGTPSGELAVRTFEEQTPATEAELPYCWVEKSWGVGNRTLEANRNATDNKNFDAVKENLLLAKIFLYDAYGPAIYNPNLTSEDPVGLWAACGQCYESSNVGCVAAGQTYAGKTLNTSAITTQYYGLTRSEWDDEQFAPLVGSIEDVCDKAGVPTLTKWSDGCIQALAYMAEAMSLTTSVSGTGSRIKPDIAIMNTTPFMTLKSKFTTAQVTGYQIPLGKNDLVLADFPHIIVDSLVCIKDTDVPDDNDNGGSGSGKDMVFVLDSKQFNICTTHKKSEGLIKSEFDAEIALISGVVGALQMNLAYQLNSPTAIGCIVGCND